MKKIQYIKYVFIGCFAAMMFACNTLDVPPMNVIKDSEVFGDQSGVSAYMARLYIQLPLIDKQDAGGKDKELYSFTVIPDRVSDANGGDIGYSNWNGIREASYFIQEFPNYRNNFNEIYANAWLGEAYFARAFIFFEMVKVYGGLPIVQRVLNYPQESIEDLKLPRDKEDDCYAAILSDLDKAIELLPETSTTDVGLARGRVNKYAALAMKSRVALWAASIAKYGTATLATYANEPAVQQGLVGVPASKANEYFELALSTAKSVVSGGKYELYGIGLSLDDSKAIINSYRNMYLDKTDANKEIIFAKYYQYPDTNEGVNGNCLPAQFASTYPYHLCATMEFVKMFDDADGNTVNWNNILGNDQNYSSHLYENPEEAFASMEPRFKAIMLYPNAEYKTEKTEIRKGILPEGKFVDGGSFNMADVLLSANMNNQYNDMDIQGASGMGESYTTSTGFYVIKYANEAFTRAQAIANPSMGEALYPEIRYAEVLLNIAEAAIELGRPAEATQPMNDIRKRAGSRKVFTSGNITLENVRNERLMELVWECKSYWDLKRWRQMHVRYDNTTFGIMWPIYVWDKSAYYLRLTDTGETDNKRVTYALRRYYTAISAADVSANMIQNPGY